jgi:hypothetical protein
VKSEASSELGSKTVPAISEDKAAPRQKSPERERRRFFEDDNLRLRKTCPNEGELVAPAIRQYHAINAPSPQKPNSTLKTEDATISRRPLITYGKNRQHQLVERKDAHDGEEVSLPMMHPILESQVKSNRDQRVDISASPACPESDDNIYKGCEDDFQGTESQESTAIDEFVRMAPKVSNPDANIGLKRSTIIPEHQGPAGELTKLDSQDRAPRQESQESQESCSSDK